MRSLTRSGKYGSKAPPLEKLNAEDVPAKNPVLTVERVNEYPDGEGGHFLGIVFGEFPEKEYKTNATQEDALNELALAGKLPDDLDRWPGQKIPFYKKTNTFEGVSAVKMYAVDPEKFDAALVAPTEKETPAKAVKKVVRRTTSRK